MGKLDPDIRRVLTGKCEVEMFFKLTKDAPRHAPHCPGWNLVQQYEEPDEDNPKPI